MPKTLTLRAQVFLILIPTLLYLGLFFARSWWIHPWCAVNPSPCTQASLPFFELYSFTYRSVMADFISNLLQNGIGVFAFVFPWVFLKDRIFERSARLNLTLLALIAWNGTLVEIVRAIVQRPRPLVYLNPLTDGSHVDQYTSFYSGHTSFVAMALTFLIVISSRYGTNGYWGRKTLFFLYFVATLATAILRVVGGRHFPTDTLAGAVMGTLVGLLSTRILVRRI